MPSNSNDQYLNAAIKLISQKDYQGACANLKTSINRNPNQYYAWLLLSMVLFKTGKAKEAIHIDQKAQQFDPLQTDFQLIQECMQKNNFDEAEKTAKLMLDKIPSHPRAVFTLAHIASQKGYVNQALSILNQGIENCPANLMFREMLVSYQEVVGDYNSAISSAKTLVNLNKCYQTLCGLLQLLLRLGQYDDLLALCEQAKTLSDNDQIKLSQILLIQGSALRIKGQQAECISVFKKSLETNKFNVDAWWALANLKTYQFSANDTAALRTLINQHNLSQSAKCTANFALAKASELDKEWDEAIRLYKIANAIHPAKSFNTAQFEHEFRMRINLFSPENLQTQATTNQQVPIPIFIVGLPRSGSTLVEQILASHSEIEGTIEQPTLPAIERCANEMCMRKYNGGLFTSLNRLTQNELTQLGNEYLNKGRLFRDDSKPYFIDKLPFNFRHIGLIHKILPKAIIIDVRRNPLDCGYSLYKQYFPSGVDFSYNLTNIGKFYTSYCELMLHWEYVLPNKVYTLQYENLVNNPKQMVEALLSHIGLDFEASCLDFHENTRRVHTASSEQVRAPLNTAGVGNWRKVENELLDLKQSLNMQLLKQAKKYS